MTFTQQIKDELCRVHAGKKCCQVAECLGYMLFAAQFSPGKLRIQTESPRVRLRIQQLLRYAFGIDSGDEPQRQTPIEITDEKYIRAIYEGFGYDYKNAPLHLNLAVIEEECCKSAFLRGAFLVGGYVSASGKGYHLEIVTAHYNVSRQVSALLLDLDMPAGYIQRRGNHVLYYKDSALIEDFLSAAGATNSAMDLMLKKVERDLRNNVNRKVNCETANLGKTVEAASRQIDAIDRLEEAGKLDKLPPELKQTAQLRRQNPEMSLSELVELFDPPISRPGLSGRLRKLEQLAKSIHTI